MFYRDSYFSILLSHLLSFFLFCLSSFFRHVLAELAERNSTKIGHLVGSTCDLKTHVRNLGYPLSYKWGGGKNTFFDDFVTQRQL